MHICAIHQLPTSSPIDLYLSGLARTLSRAPSEFVKALAVSYLNVLLTYAKIGSSTTPQVTTPFKPYLIVDVDLTSTGEHPSTTS